MDCNIGGLRDSPTSTVIQWNMVVFNLLSKKLTTSRRPKYMFYLTFVKRHVPSIESIAKFFLIVGCPQAFPHVENRLGHCGKFIKFKEVLR
jgi:hypothetical protein